MIQMWLIAAGIRAGKTFAEVLGAGLVVGATIASVPWGPLLSTAVVATLASLLWSVKGLPELVPAPVQPDDTAQGAPALDPFA